MALTLVLLAVGGGAAWLVWPAGPIQSGDLAAEVRRGELEVVIAEPGELESAQSVSCRCEVEGRQIKIIEIAEEGTQVKKDQVVVRFDAEELMKAFQDQEIKLKQAEGKARAAEEELKVQRNKAESDIDKARLALTLAELDLEKYLSPQGDYQVSVEDTKGMIALANKDFEEAAEQLNYYRTFVKKGFGTPESLRQREAAVERAKFNLLRDKAKLFVLENFEYKRKKAELEAKARDAKRDLERAESTSQASVDKAKSELEAAQVTARLEKRALERLQKQLDFCVVKAPQDGILVYENARYWDPSTAIRPGGMVYYQQPIFKLPDLSRMKVKLKVHESQVKKVAKGQPAEILVASLGNRALRGSILNVATLADSNGPWDERGVKEYLTEVSIDEMPPDAGLKPGMTAEVRIHVGKHPDVLLAPVSAVAEREGKHYAFVLAGGAAEKRPVRVGETNEKFIIVKDGLKEGERVALNARRRLAAEIKGKPTGPAPQPTAGAAPPASSPPAAAPLPGPTSAR